MIYPDLPYNAVLCRYNEIATKGRNRRQFEDRLVSGIRRVLKGLGSLRLQREAGRLYIQPEEGVDTFTPADLAEIRHRLPVVTGLASASPGFLIRPEFAEMERVIDESFDTVYRAVADSLPAGEPVTYRMRANRNNKRFPMRALELEIHFAERLVPRYEGMVVDLKHAALSVELDVRHVRAFVCYERIPGPGGLPEGTGGRLLAMLSGGIDSPVACYQMMRRGCRVDYVTFHSAPYTPPALFSKVARLAEILNDFQAAGRLYAVNLLPAQRLIRDECRSRYRTILYRRFMVRIANRIADFTEAKALLTGDNMGQVASQTLANMAIIDRVSERMILRPLVAFDKQDTVAIAERIGTMAESRESVPDSCTVFAPQDPCTAATLRRIEDEEAKLDVAALVEECLAATVRLDLATLAETSWAQLTGNEAV
jgi:thiamine biosynthesis protein ThiI